MDFRTLALKQAQTPAHEMARLRELLSSTEIRALNDEYDRNWEAVDFSTKLVITTSQERRDFISSASTIFSIFNQSIKV